CVRDGYGTGLDYW
nr:immunoglobulin heavy chain junction region [Macaca mulatta]